MRSRVYVETSIISYLTARPSRDIVLAGRQEVTREWWEHRRKKYDLVVSQVVHAEIAAGDTKAASARRAMIADLPVLDTSDDAIDLAAELVKRGVLPERAAADALHLAVSATSGVAILLTWNCRHLANPRTMERAYDVLRSMGLRPPMICTPDELTGDESHE